uniref:Uncharacterized protein n=1 Tax=Amphimedon queenslandica TaxID=400682 RepID=A0A1X7T5V5_AMPQE
EEFFNHADPLSEGNITTSSITALNNRSFQKEDILLQGAEEMNKELYEAAKRGDSTGVQSALSQGANVNYQNPEK